jgi:hypothetical protein
VDDTSRFSPQPPPGWRDGWVTPDPLPRRRADAQQLLDELRQRRRVTPDLTEARLRAQPASEQLRQRLAAALRRARRGRETPALAAARRAARGLDRRAACAAVEQLRDAGFDPTRLARATRRILLSTPGPGDVELALDALEAIDA